MRTLMQWLRAHLLPVPEPHPPQALREASHRLANERMALRGELSRAAGGPQKLDLLIARMRDDKQWM